jgi:hypothetical protein
MSALGKLVASVILDTAEWTVGTDKAKHLAAQTASSIDGSFKDLERNVKSTLGGIAAAAAAGFGIAALRNTFDAYAEGAAKLVDLAAKAGTTVEALSGIAPIAKFSATSMDDVANAAAKLAKGVVNAGDSSTGAGKALAFLGISAKDANGRVKDSVTLMEEIAGKLSQYEDGIVKTTIAQDLFGKTGANMIPFLKDLAEYGVQDATITTAQARAAKEYEEDLVRLGMAKSAVGKIISKEFLPVADAVVKVMLEMTTKSGGLRDKTKQLAEDGSLRQFAMMGVQAIALLINAGDSVMRIFDAVGEGIGVFIARVSNTLGAVGDAVIHFIRGEYRQAWDDLQTAGARDAAMVEDSGNRIRGIFEKPLAGDQFVKTVEEKLAQIDAASRKSADAAKKTGAAYIEGAKAAAVNTTAIDSFLDSLGKQTVKLQENLQSLRLYGVETKETALAVAKFELAEGNLAKVMKELAKVDPDEAERLKKKILLLAGQKDAVEASLESERKYNEARKAWVETQAKAIQAIDQQVEEEKRAIATFGMSKQAVTEYAVAQLEARKAILQMTEGTEAEIAALNAQIAALKDLASLQGQRQELENQSRLWGDIADKAGHFFADLLTNGRSAFSNLRDQVKSLAQEMIAFFAKRWILQMVAGGSGAGATAASAALNGMGSSATSSLMSGMISGAGTGIGGAFGTGVLTGAGDFVGTGLAGMAGNLALAAGATDAFAATVAAAVPVIGWIVAIAAVLYSIYGQSAGGPKGGGSFMGSFDASGNLTGPMRVPNTDNGRFFTPGQSDPQMQALSAATGRGYVDFVRALGGNAQGMQFGFGFDTDPNGTAQNRVSSEVRDASGRLIYGVRDREIGRDQNQIGPELQLEASRAMLAALQHSDLPSYLAHVFDGLTASTATQEQINDAIKAATALKTIFDVVTRDPLADLAASTEANSNRFQTALRNNATAIKDAMSHFDHSTASTEHLRDATIAYYNAQLQLISGIDQVKQSVDDLFGGTIRSLEMGGMDKQGQYDFLRNEAATLQQQALASSDPETVRRLAEQINADLNAAFNLLSPEEQNAHRAEFLSGTRSTQAALDARLEALRRQAIEDTKDVLRQIKELIGANTQLETHNAATNLTAANTQLTAAQTPRTLILQSPNGEQQVITLP